MRAVPLVAIGIVLCEEALELMIYDECKSAAFRARLGDSNA
jgi:hypothetical protein